NWAVANDHPAKRRLLICREGFFPRLPQIIIASHPTWVCVFENRDGWVRKFCYQICRRTNVENVVKGEIFPVQFLEVLVKIAIKRGGLLRILPITQARNQRERK